MDIAASQFWRVLPIVIKEIAEAHFVSIDLEFSGVRAKRKPDREINDPPTSQQLYENARAAAETFQVLQFGLTCVRHVSPAEGYAARTFNFSLTPLTPVSRSENLDRQLIRIIDRQVTLSQYSMSFLQKHGFRLEDAWNNGIPYLSRREEEDCNLYFSNRDNQQQREPYMEIEEQDEDTRHFYERVKTIVNQYPPEQGACFITNPYGGRLNSLQFRLIRQCLEVEFPEKYQTFPMMNNSRMEIVPQESRYQAEYQAWKAKERNAALRRHTGFRFVIEALVGGSFAEDIHEMCRPSADDSHTKLYVSNEDLDKMIEYERQLRTGRRPVLVGHNHFTDLCFLYQAFIGPLPKDLVDFKHEIHRIFPRMIDTKYMTMRGRSPMFPDDNLEELYNSVKRKQNLLLKCDAELGYSNNSTHEAGYDSWMTALVFIEQAFSLSRDTSVLRAMPEDAPDYDKPTLGLDLHLPCSGIPSPNRSSPRHADTGYQKSKTRRFLSQSLPVDIPSTTGIAPAANFPGQGFEGSVSLIDSQGHAEGMSKYQPLEPSNFISGGGRRSKSENEPETFHTMASLPIDEGLSWASTSFNQLPDWESEFFQKMGNKLRMGSGMVAVFGPLQNMTGEADPELNKVATEKSN